ncbi:hypothetical protein Q4508_09140 [Amphritea sp. 2_MG-2023]|jgi:hypothetical protein|uniref:hypothetical protein n=1 Tax=Amphritea TaxID=515417 RepID=UPI001C06B086|nr:MULTISPECIES: hypothetical protein [Amphritea]MBU2965567.1 hypothetical protein [Amphritea atlantica]MDO6418722.1 hypothetical protein [Amphritea sp. 2_MG-2023]MDX2421825.1 hypothetical protein [Amphritea sp.]
MSNGGQQIESLLRRISQQQNAPAGETFDLQNPIAGGLGRVGSVSLSNNSRQSQQGFSSLISTMRMLREMPGLNAEQLQQNQQRQAAWPDPETVPMPPVDEQFNTQPDPADEDDTPD